MERTAGAPPGQEWPKGELYEGLCLLGIAECMWLIGSTLDVFPTLQLLALQNGLSNFVFLGFFMSFAIGVASVLKSVRLRREITARRSAEVAAQSSARRDVLTALPNRRMLLECIGNSVERGRGAVFLIDLDRFKPVNDIYGHAAGDAVLCEIADRLRRALPREAVPARLGGDEFAAFLPGEMTADELMRLAQQLIQQLSQAVEWQNSRVTVGATVGIALLPQDGPDAEALLRSADIAMYRAKREGRGTYRFFEQAMDEELKARLSLEAELRSAIEAGDVRPHYQPLVALPGHALLGFEVLARWYHPQRGIISPNVFVPIAEDTGLVTEMCYGLLRQACLDARNWPAHLGLAINISPVQFKEGLLAPRILAILRDTGFSPKRLEVEITETALTEDLDVARATLSTLQAAGVSVALDDFGTGYSSLYHLREMNFDKIKIDRSFVQSLGGNEESAKIISAILGLGRSLGIMTTAEGIESADNSAWLAEMGCMIGQGFLFGAPMPASLVPDLIRSNVALPAPNREAA
ncbi:EAL domain-containing protein [Enterovirga sp.]|uniref:putative bifunctional diguanylate cyclase/phosphodiesterase n=1 Tax=Enterovirga sp. TaxID=2026350 RepID=UPI00261ED525|nr:EAL domain-containing protein [Enterovirga sp.]MDB5589536.1 diguanylate cyclase/phosphodiesterase [Enterovirga sp.]